MLHICLLSYLQDTVKEQSIRRSLAAYFEDIFSVSPEVDMFICIYILSRWSFNDFVIPAVVFALIFRSDSFSSIEAHVIPRCYWAALPIWNGELFISLQFP